MIAREAVDRVGSRLLFSQVITAVRLAQEFRALCRAKEWTRALDRCEQLRIALATLVDDSKLSSAERQLISLSLDDMSLIMRRVESIDQEKIQPTIPPKMMETLDRIVISLTRVDGRLKALMLEI